MHKAKKLLVIGLGNPTMPSTRHSIGMTVMDAIANKLQLSWRYCTHCGGKLAHRRSVNSELYLLKPKYLMNINGKSVKKAVTHLSVPVSDILVVHDDLDRSLGKLSLKMEGSAGGHKGVTSVMSNLSTDKFRRIRFGIGRPADKSQVTNYVLSEFREEELDQVQTGVDNCIEIVLKLMAENYGLLNEEVTES